VNPADTVQSTLKGLAGALPGAAGTGSGNATGVGPKNEQWLASEAKKDSATASPIVSTPLASPYTLMETGTIPVVILGGVNSSLPAEIRAMVTDDVYDNVPGGGTHLLIRAGSIVAAHPNTDIVRAQDRMMIAFSRLILYGGSTLNLAAMGGTDEQGVGGIEAQTNTHFFRRFGAAILLAGISTVAQRATSTDGVNVNVGSSLTSSSENALSQVMQAILGDNVNIQDTLTLDPGKRMTIVVNRDLYLPPSVTGNPP
jgi:type IV secretion system protein VirB10